jgi:subtilisin-like proprotein convertase family protein
MKPLITLTFLAVCPLPVHAASTVNFIYAVGTPVPDNSAIGISDTRQVATSITSISEVNVQLTISGGWSGDLYAYITHGSGFSVLLNRPGRSLAEIAGSGASDVFVTFADTALTDIHTGIPASGIVSGFYQPDARGIDPDNSLDTSRRSAFLSSFNGLDANGNWTLFVADVATGDAMTLANWSLTVRGVPEPTTGMLILVGVTLGSARRWRS